MILKVFGSKKTKDLNRIAKTDFELYSWYCNDIVWTSIYSYRPKGCVI